MQPRSVEEPTGSDAPLVVCAVAGVHVALPEPHARLELVSQQPEHPGSLSLPISIEQARVIALILARQRVPRPLTHELASELLHALGGAVLRCVLRPGAGSVVEATLSILREDGTILERDARPSDAIALCLLEPVPAPILAIADVLT